MTTPIEALRSLGGGKTVTLGTATSQISPATNNGCLGFIAVTGTGTGTRSFYQGTSAGGTLLFTVPGSASLAAIYEFPVPFVGGLFVDGVTAAPALTVTYNDWSANSGM